MITPWLLLAAGFVAQAVLVRSRVTAAAALGVAGLVLAAGFGAGWREPLLAVAVLGPLVTGSVATLAGPRRWSAADRGAVLLGGAGAAASAVTWAWGGRDQLEFVAGGAGALVLVVLLLAGADGADAGRRARGLWLTLGVGTAAVGAGGGRLLPTEEAWVWCAGLTGLALPAAAVLAARAPAGLDVRRLTSSAVVHGVTALAVVAGFSGAAAAFEVVAGSAPGRRAVLVMLVVSAAGYGPLLGVLRPRVEALLFGRRLDPLPVLVDLGRELQTGTTASWLVALCRACGVPWAELRADRQVVAVAGTPTDLVHRNDLLMDGQVVGELRVGLEPGTALPRETGLVLALLATPLAHALRSARLAADLQLSRERTVAARDEERRRVGHDLHDGLGASLTGLGYSADAAARLLRTRPDDAVVVLEQLRQDAHDALAQVRRTVADLRPAELDGVGLVVALERFCERYRGAGLDVELVAGPLPDLPADVELTVHRVVTEAVTNTARHAGAARVRIALTAAAGELVVTVADDGSPGPAWVPGTGLRSMAERAERLGGGVQAGPRSTGGFVELRLPVVPASPQELTGVVREMVADPRTRDPR